MNALSYEQAKALIAEAERTMFEASARLNSIPGVGSGYAGLTPEHVRCSPQYRKAKMEFDAAFANLRELNSWFVENFAKEIRAERRRKMNITTAGV